MSTIDFLQKQIADCRADLAVYDKEIPKHEDIVKRALHSHGKLVKAHSGKKHDPKSVETSAKLLSGKKDKLEALQVAREACQEELARLEQKLVDLKNEELRKMSWVSDYLGPMELLAQAAIRLEKINEALTDLFDLAQELSAQGHLPLQGLRSLLQLGESREVVLERARDFISVVTTLSIPSKDHIDKINPLLDTLGQWKSAIISRKPEDLVVEAASNIRPIADPTKLKLPQAQTVRPPIDPKVQEQLDRERFKIQQPKVHDAGGYYDAQGRRLHHVD